MMERRTLRQWPLNDDDWPRTELFDESIGGPEFARVLFKNGDIHLMETDQGYVLSREQGGRLSIHLVGHGPWIEISIADPDRPWSVTICQTRDMNPTEHAVLGPEVGPRVHWLDESLRVRADGLFAPRVTHTSTELIIDRNDD